MLSDELMNMADRLQNYCLLGVKPDWKFLSAVTEHLNGLAIVALAMEGTPIPDHKREFGLRIIDGGVS